MCAAGSVETCAKRGPTQPLAPAVCIGPTEELSRMAVAVPGEPATFTVRRERDLCERCTASLSNSRWFKLLFNRSLDGLETPKNRGAGVNPQKAGSIKG